ncbi:zinc knuckle CX2CX4HX4C containing protein [Tanacetum coccineum]
MVNGVKEVLDDFVSRMETLKERDVNVIRVSPNHNSFVSNAGTFVTSKDGLIRQVVNQSRPDNTMETNASSSGVRSCSDEIFGGEKIGSQHDTDLKKAEVRKAPVWIKLHHVPIVAYSEIGLSLITTQLGKPITLDSYTSTMCFSSWAKCPKIPKVAPAKKVDEEGFVEVKKKKHKNKNRQTKIAGVRLSKPTIHNLT